MVDLRSINVRVELLDLNGDYKVGKGDHLVLLSTLNDLKFLKANALMILCKKNSIAIMTFVGITSVADTNSQAKGMANHFTRKFSEI